MQDSFPTEPPGGGSEIASVARSQPMRLAARLTLHQRVLLVALLPAALIAAFVTALVVYRGTEVLDDALRERGIATVRFLAPAAEYGVISGNRTSLDMLLAAVMHQRDVSGVAIYDAAGLLIASSGRFGMSDRELLRATERPTVVDATDGVLAALAPVFPSSVPLDDILPPDIAEPAAPEPAAVGWVYVELNAQPVQREKNRMIAASLALLLAGLTVASMLAARLARSVSEPVARLVAGVQEMAGGALDVHLPEQAVDSELSALERGFNTMARSISDIHRTMQSRIDSATAQLAHQAHHDPLTGLPNRRVFERRLEETVAASRRVGDHGALCFIDLDHFKIVNDSCGHAAGDELLCGITRVIRHKVREQDLVCRIGGDEFALILRGCTAQDARRIAEGLRDAVASYRFEWEGREFSVGASIGLVPIDGRHESPAEVLVAADLACYGAKRSGRNQVVQHVHGIPAALADPPAGNSPPAA